MNNLFSNCLSLEQIPDISKWNTSKVSQMNNIFYNCRSWESLKDISNWDLSNIKYLTDYIIKLNEKDCQTELLKDMYFGEYNFNLRTSCICQIKGSEYGLGIFCKFSEYGKITKVLLTFLMY